jgi:hypothetical protein
VIESDPPAVVTQKRKQDYRDERVWTAISDGGARTQREIKLIARVWNNDELGEALAELILNRRWVKSRIAEDGRIYFPNPGIPGIQRKGLAG